MIMLLSYPIIDMQIWSLLTSSQYSVSDTQVNIKACGPLVLFGVGFKYDPFWQIQVYTVLWSTGERLGL